MPVNFLTPYQNSLVHWPISGEYARQCPGPLSVYSIYTSVENVNAFRSKVQLMITGYYIKN